MLELCSKNGCKKRENGIFFRADHIVPFHQTQFYKKNPNKAFFTVMSVDDIKENTETNVNPGTSCLPVQKPITCPLTFQSLCTCKHYL